MKFYLKTLGNTVYVKQSESFVPLLELNIVTLESEYVADRNIPYKKASDDATLIKHYKLDTGIRNIFLTKDNAKDLIASLEKFINE